jgi:deoxyribonuclease V
MAAWDWQRFGAVDVHYPPEGGARAALVVATEPRFGKLVEEHVAWLDKVEPYEPGRFFVRELPAIQAVLAKAAALDVLIIDGYVDLDPDGRPGLGAHVHDHVGIPIIGVAKTAFRAAAHAVAVHRGTAIRPLYVTATGVPVKEAADMIASMAGPHRIPDALRRVDRLARTDNSDGRGD